MSEDNLWRSMFAKKAEELKRLFQLYTKEIDSNDNPEVEIELEVRFNRKNATTGMVPGVTSNLFEKALKRLPSKPAEVTSVSYYANDVRRIGDDRQSVVQKKQRLAIVDLDTVDLRFSLAKETNYPPTILVGHTPSFSRERQRYSYSLPEMFGDQYPIPASCQKVRIDFTRVISSGTSPKDNRDQYEIEIECPIAAGTEPMAPLNDFLTVLKDIYKFINDTALFFLPGRKEIITQQIMKIFSDVGGGGPFQPWWLVQTRNIKKADILYGGLVGGPRQYCVTHKADGVRKLLLIAGGEVWLIMPANEFNYLGKIEGLNIMALFDGEYIDHDRQGNKRYYIFDTIVYFDPTQRGTTADKRYVQNYLERLSYGENLISSLGGREITVSQVIIAVKPVFPLANRESFFQVMRAMFAQKASLPYNTDGLVFTPINEKYDPGNSKIPNNQRILTDYADLVKWKPAEHITADFLVKIEGNENGKPLLALYYSEPVGKIKHGRFVGTKRYPFNSFTDIEDNQLYYQIGTNNVVEFGFNYQTQKLYPTRIRYDKSGPNRKPVIDNVWKDIHDPISAEYLMGLESSLIFSCHNEVKRNILQQYIQGGKILDIGSGRGGDLGKWERLYDPKILCIEPNPENIMEFINRLKNKSEQFQKRVFLVETGGEDSETITKNVEKYFNGVADSVTMMLSLSFFWQSEEMLDRLVQTIIRNTGQGSRFAFLTVDDVYLQPGFHQTIVGTFDVQSKLPGQFSNLVKVNLPDTIVGEQTEYLVHLPDLYQRLEKYGFKILAHDRIDHDVLLSDEQLQYSRFYSWGVLERTEVINPVVEATIPQGNLVKTERSMIKLPLLPDDQKVPIDCDFYPSVYRIGVIGDGSCLIHAFLKAVFEAYRNSPTDQRIAMADQMRIELATLLQNDNSFYPGHNWWSTVGDGIFLDLSMQQLKTDNLKDFNNVDWTLRGLQRLLNSRSYLGDEIFSLIAAVFNIDIYLFQAETVNGVKTLTREAYYTYTKPRNQSIAILWVNRNHFELIGTGDDKTRLLFNNDDPFIQAVNQRYPQGHSNDHSGRTAFNPDQHLIKVISQLMVNDDDDSFLDKIYQTLSSVNDPLAEQIKQHYVEIVTAKNALKIQQIKDNSNPV